MYYLRTPLATKIPCASGSSATRPRVYRTCEPNSSCSQANHGTITAFEADQDLTGTDVLRGLDYLRSARVELDERLAEAMDLVERKWEVDGRWPPENPHAGKVHCDMEDGAGQSSRWNALRGLRVLDRYSARCECSCHGKGNVDRPRMPKDRDQDAPDTESDGLTPVRVQVPPSVLASVAQTLAATEIGMAPPEPARNLPGSDGDRYGAPGTAKEPSQDRLRRPAKIGDRDSEPGRTISYLTAAPVPGTGFRSARRSVPAKPSSGRR